MTALQRLSNRVAKYFQSGYDAVKSNGKRKPAPTVLKSEDYELKGQDRHAMLGTTRDLARNFVLVAWAIRKHLDYVSMFDFQSRTGDSALDVQIETLMTNWQRPQNCDAAGRHNFSRMLRLFESCRTKDGDVFALKLNRDRKSTRLNSSHSSVSRMPSSA